MSEKKEWSSTRQGIIAVEGHSLLTEWGPKQKVVKQKLFGRGETGPAIVASLGTSHLSTNKTRSS
jgi:hypothetical protein